MDGLKSGWKSSEFWLTLVKIGLGFAVTFGVVSQTDASTINGAAASMIAAVVCLFVNGSVVKQYMEQRFKLKAAMTPTEVTLDGQSVKYQGAGNVIPFLIAAVAAGLLAGPAPAQQPAYPPVVIVTRDLNGQHVTETCLWGRAKTDPALMALMQQLVSLQQQSLQAQQANAQAIQQQMAALTAAIAQLAARPAPAPAPAYPTPGGGGGGGGHIMYDTPYGKILVPPAGSGQPIIHIPAPGSAPLISLPPPGTAPPIVLPAPGSAPRIDIPGPGAAPKIDIPAPGGGGKVTPMPGADAPASGQYQQFSGAARPPVTHAIWQKKK